MSNILEKAFAESRNRQVLAVITYGVAPKKEMTGRSLMDLFRDAQHTLLKPRTWFKYDRCLLDEDLEDQVRQTIFDQKEIVELYAKLDSNPTPALVRQFIERYGEDAVKDVLEDIMPQRYSINFRGDELPQDKIRMHVPFERLQRDLLNIARALESTARGFLERVDIEHAPRFAPEIKGTPLPFDRPAMK